MYVYDAGSMSKVRSDGTFYKQGIAEPQVAPVASVSASGALTLQAQWAYVYRSSTTGAVSNPSVLSNPLSLANQSASILAQPSSDPQVDTIDFYRQDIAGGSLPNLTYVGSIPTGPGVTGPVNFIDNLPDLVVASNPIISYANFEPFPTVGLPIRTAGQWSGGQTGNFTVTGGITLPVNLLPGTTVLMNGTAGTVLARPVNNVVQLSLASSVVYTPASLIQIQNPVLGATPLPFAWGPTDNVQFIFAVGDKNNPGRLYWTTGNNPDASADTNTQDVTSGSEILMNGCLVNGIGMVFSNQRAWLIYPNFFNAVATITGVLGQPFTLVESIANRGLVAPRGLTTDGGGTVYFVSTDGVYASPGGNGSQSITQGDIDNLFPHEGDKTTTPAPIVRGGVTIYPPSYGALAQMVLRMSGPFLYFDHINSQGAPQTLVYDTTTGGWTFDAYADPVSVHGWEDLSMTGTWAEDRPVCGSATGNVYTMTIAGTETATAFVSMPCDNAGDSRADKQWGDIYVRAATDTGTTIAVTAYSNLYHDFIGTDPGAIGGGPDTSEFGYVIDFEPQGEIYARDLGAQLSWAIGHNTILSVWQPSFIPVPETINGRVSNWDNAGVIWNKWVQGFLLEGDTQGQAKGLSAQGEGGQIATPSESVVLNGRGVQAFSFPQPMITHVMRLNSADDNIPYRLYNLQWVFEPYPESCMNWVSEPTSHGFVGWQHVREMNVGHRSTSDLTLVLTPDAGPAMSFSIPNSNNAVTKTKVTINSNKFKVMQYALFSTAPFYPFLDDMEVKLGLWGRTGPYQMIKPFGGPSKTGALV
jgi:hypothetical protein